jgi:proton-translocating NADH-quinone oxidoreductase chain L
MTLLATFLPFLNFLLMLAFSRWNSVHWKHLSSIVILNMAALLIFLVFMFEPISQGFSYTSTLGNWLLSGLFEVNWTFSIDALTYTMLLVVLTVSTLVHLYSTEYMSEDPHVARFISYLSLFTFFMLLLVTSNNFVGLFLGWEGVGLCSYLLISFWFTRVQANKAAIKAMVVNRVSDLFFIIGILVIFYTFQTVEFNTVFGLTPYMCHSSILVAGYAISPITLIAALLFLGAMGKSAQIGLHTWLPDAMEGPTPVSALIHAATMVTAGVFLIIRCSPLFECAPTVLVIVTIIGAGTAFMAATSGLLQNDLKKVIAYSTCSQLGYMIFACGLSGYTASLFHLSTHAFFKALLFLSAGAVIHAVASEQDLRRFGGLRQLLPYTYAAFFVGSIALMGVPFLSGFYSKDLILEVAGGAVSVPANFAYSLGLISAFFTSFYSFRLLHLAFYGNARSSRLPLAQTHELGPRMATALFVLSIGTVFLGVFGRDIFVGPGTDFWNDSVAVNPTLVLNQLSGEFLPTLTKQIPLFGVIVATALVFYTYDSFVLTVTPYVYRVNLQLYRFFSLKWGFDAVYNRFINKPLLQGAYNIPFSLIDKGVLEQFGPTGLGKVAVALGHRLTMAQTGYVADYAAVLLLAALLCAVVFVLSGLSGAVVLAFLPVIVRPAAAIYSPLLTLIVRYGSMVGWSP